MIYVQTEVTAKIYRQLFFLISLFVLKMTTYYHRKIELNCTAQCATWTPSDIKIALKVGGPDKLAEGVCAWRRLQLYRPAKLG